MAEITTGVQIQGTLTPTYDEDNYAVTDPKYGIGGYREIPAVAALTNPLDPNFIPEDRQSTGMLVYAADTDLIYKLVTPDSTTPVYAVLSTGTSGLNSNYQIGGLENTLQITATDGPVILTQAGVDPGNNGLRLNNSMRMQLGDAAGTLWSFYRDGPPVLRLNCTVAALDTPGDAMFFEAGTGGAASATSGGVGGTVDFKAGKGGAAATGSKPAGAGGAFYYTAGEGGAAFASESPGAGGGSLVFNAGRGGSGATAQQGGVGGGLTITAGAGGVAGGGTEGFGGTTNIRAGASLANIAGSTNILGGGTSTGTAGETYVEGGPSGGSSTGGDSYLRGGINTSTGNGGDAHIRGGFSSGGTVGNVYLGDQYTTRVEIGQATSGSHLRLVEFTTAQRNAVASPQAGAQVFNTDTNTMQFYDGAVWADIGAGGAGNTLNAAYDEGGAGAGRQIDVDNTLPVHIAAGTGTPTEALHVDDDLKVEFGTGKDDSIYYDSTADRLVIESTTEIDLAPANDELLLGATAPSTGGRCKVVLKNSVPVGGEIEYGRGSIWVDMANGVLYINMGISTNAVWFKVGQQN